MKKKNIFLVILVLMILGWGITAYLYLDYKYKDTYHGKIYHRQAPRFVLIGHEGDPIRLDQFRDKIVLISWGYTNCPDICPLTLANLKEVIELLGSDANNVQVLFITVDPERDTAERMKAYVPYFQEDFIGLTGTQEEIEEIANEYGVTIVKHPAVYGRGRFDTWDRYLMTHTNTVHLVDKSGILFLTYPHYKHNPKEMAKDIKKLLHDQ